MRSFPAPDPLDAQRRPLFLTMGMSGDVRGMVEDHEARHRAYCDRWGYEYLAVEALPEGVPLDSWTRPRLILDFMRSGRFSHVFWVDADTFVADLGRDMRETLPPWAWLGLTAHPYPWRKLDAIHLQTGMFYFRCCPKAEAFLAEVLRFAGVDPDEQFTINRLLMGDGPDAEFWGEGFRLLSFRWNNTLHDQEESPIVAAFHGHLGYAERRALMREVAERYPWKMA